MNVNFNKALSSRISISMGLSDSTTKFDEQALFDNRTDAANLSLSYQWTPEISMNLNYGYSIYTFDQGGNRSNENSESVNINIGYVKPHSPTFSSSFSAGISSVSGFYDTTVFVGQANFEKRFKSSSISLAYSRNLSSSTGLNTEININDSVSVMNSYTISEQMTLSINGTVSKNSSRRTGSDDTISYLAGINGSWQAKSWMRLGFGYSHYEQETESLIAEDLSTDLVYINICAACSVREGE